MKPAPYLSELIIEAREKRNLTQTQLAKRCNLSNKRLSELECDSRAARDDELEVLSSVLRIPLHELRATKAQSSPAFQKALGKFRPRTTRVLVRRDRHSRIRYHRARKRYQQQIAALESKLRRRSDALAIRVYLRDACFDSDLEYLLHLRLLQAGAVPGRASPQDAGLTHLPVVDPLTRGVTGHLKFPALALDEWLFLPQLSLLTGQGVLTLDFCWATRRNGRCVWRDLEIDGDGHDPSRDHLRAEATRLPVVRFYEHDLKELVDKLRSASEDPG